MQNDDLEPLYVNLKDTAYYLISLFYKTGQKYSCTSTKIGKLISILAFQYALDGKKLLDEEIYKYGGCGTLIEKLSFLPKDIYRPVGMNYIYDKRYIDDVVDDSLMVHSFYRDFKDIPFDVRLRAEEVFRTFGAYSHMDLGKLLNPIVDRTVDEKTDIIVLSKMPLAISQMSEDNEIVRFLRTNAIYDKTKVMSKKYNW